MSIRDERGGQVPRPERETAWDHGNTVDNPNTFDRVGIVASNSNQRAYGGAVLTELGQKWDMWNGFVDQAVIQDLLDLANKVMTMAELVFNPSTAEHIGGQWQVSITPDSGNPGQFNVLINTVDELDFLAMSSASVSESTDGNFHLTFTKNVSGTIIAGQSQVTFAPTFQIPSGLGGSANPITSVVLNMVSHSTAASATFISGVLTVNIPTPLDGTNGTNGITPQLRVLGGEVEVSYDSGDTWTNLFPVPADGVTPLLQVIAGYVTVSYDGGATNTPLFLIPTAPVIGTPTVDMLPAGDDPSVTRTGAGTSGSPYIDNFHIPFPSVSTSTGGLNWPALPEPGAGPVSFGVYVLHNGTFIPYVIPVGYKFKVISTANFWHFSGGGGNEVTDGNGDSGILNGGIPIGRVILDAFDVSTLPSGSSIDTLDAFSEYVVTNASGVLIRLKQNIDEALTAGDGYLLCEVQITAAPATWSYDHDFTASDGGWLPAKTVGVDRAVWNSGAGWADVPGRMCETVPVFAFTHDSRITAGHFVLQDGVGGTANIEAITVTAQNDGSQIAQLQSLDTSHNTPGTYTESLDTAADVSAGQFILLYAAVSRTGATDDLVISSVHIEGTGVNPFV